MRQIAVGDGGAGVGEGRIPSAAPLGAMGTATRRGCRSGALSGPRRPGGGCWSTSPKPAADPTAYARTAPRCGCLPTSWSSRCRAPLQPAGMTPRRTRRRVRAPPRAGCPARRRAAICGRSRLGRRRTLRPACQTRWAQRPTNRAGALSPGLAPPRNRGDQQATNRRSDSSHHCEHGYANQSTAAPMLPLVHPGHSRNER